MPPREPLSFPGSVHGDGRLNAWGGRSREPPVLGIESLGGVAILHGHCLLHLWTNTPRARDERGGRAGRSPVEATEGFAARLYTPRRRRSTPQAPSARHPFADAATLVGTAHLRLLGQVALRPESRDDGAYPLLCRNSKKMCFGTGNFPDFEPEICRVESPEISRHEKSPAKTPTDQKRGRRLSEFRRTARAGLGRVPLTSM